MRYLALLRGINVGGKNKIKMAELRDFFEQIGFTDVRSYIQSGNVLFTSNQTVAEFSVIVEEAFLEKFGFSVPIIYRTRTEIADLIENLPFSSKEIAEAEAKDPKVAHLYVYFSPENFPSEELSAVGEWAIVRGKEVYLLTEESIRLSKLSARITRISGDLTARNWRTVLKLMELLEQAE